MKYKILTAGEHGPGPERAASSLANQVQQHLEQGWKPQGGVGLGPPDPTGDVPFVYLMQALTKD